MTAKRTTLIHAAPNALTTNRYHMAHVVFQQPDKICNAASKKPLQLSLGEPARPGADQFRQYKSFGQGC